MTVVAQCLGVVGVACVAIATYSCTADRHAASSAPSRGGLAYVRSSGTGKMLWGPGDLYTLLATGEETDGAYFQFEALVPPGGGPPPHIHMAEDESFYLAQGTLQMRMGEREVTVNTGDFVNVPKGTAHNFKNVGTESAKMLVTFVPAGFEKYFNEVFPVATDPKAPPPPVTPELIERMTKAAPKYHCTILPPPTR